MERPLEHRGHRRASAVGAEVSGFIVWLYYRIRRPYWTWRPGRPWCSTCWRWTAEPHRHFTLTLDEAAFTASLRKTEAALLARAFMAAADYERSIGEVRLYCKPAPKAVEAMRAAGLLSEDGRAVVDSQDRGT